MGQTVTPRSWPGGSGAGAASGLMYLLEADLVKEVIEVGSEWREGRTPTLAEAVGPLSGTPSTTHTSAPIRMPGTAGRGYEHRICLLLYGRGSVFSRRCPPGGSGARSSASRRRETTGMLAPCRGLATPGPQTCLPCGALVLRTSTVSMDGT
jgi:hypothetical protein